MKPDFLEKASRNFEDKYGVKLGKSGALFLSLIVQNGKENNEMIKKLLIKLKRALFHNLFILLTKSKHSILV